MNGTDLFSSKAEKYAQYRWQYAPQVIHTILEVTGVSLQSTAADVGAGTGIFTQQLVGRVGQIFVVEPNPEMRALAVRELSQHQACKFVDGWAEATTLQSASVDLITAAQAVQWFNPPDARREFKRIMKPGGWLAILRNYSTDVELGKALEKIYPVQLDTRSLMVGKNVSENYYYEKNSPLKFEFPIQSRLSWDAFLGALLTASYAPDETDLTYEEFERGARRVFDRFGRDGFICQTGVTQLYLGKVAGEYDRS